MSKKKPKTQAPPAEKKNPKGKENSQEQLSLSIQETALEAIQQIQTMVTGKEVSDSTRLAACKYAIERAAEENKPKDDKEAGVLAILMQFIRELRATDQAGRAAPPLAPPTEPQAIAPKENWDSWLRTNLDKPN